MIRHIRLGLWIAALGVCLSPAGYAARITHVYTFDYPMSWADDATPDGLLAVQDWNTVSGGNPGKALRVSASVAQQPVSRECRTLQFSHEPGTRIRVSMDVKASCSPPGSGLKIRYFDGYCSAEAFEKLADDELAPFPAPIWDSAKAKATDGWRRVSFETPVLRHTVLTLAFAVRQQEAASTESPRYVEYLLDNLKVQVTPLSRLMDLGFEWHGVRGSNRNEFRQTTVCANADWCDFADQEDVVTPEGTIHYTLLQFRDSSSHAEPSWKSEVIHDLHTPRAGGVSAIVLDRWTGGRNSSVSWGVRQTVSYSALGLKPGEQAKVRVVGKVTNFNPDDRDGSSVQIGVDAYGGVVTQKARWSAPDAVNYKTDGWRKPIIEFERPKDAHAFTIYFRHRDGVPKPPVEPLPFPEPQTAGTGVSAGVADWVMVQVVR